MKTRLLFVLLALFVIGISAQTNISKYEMRGVWVASVTNLDWPSSPNLTVAQQKAELVNMFEELKRSGVNVIFFQIRTECDALYNSPYEPWSYWLTGHQGTAPNPIYDPLQLAIDEAHKRGMELHAWVNPYRAEKTVGNYPISQNHVIYQHPDWVLYIGDYKFLNPGLPQVDSYIKKIVVDVVTRYNIDGVHMDDYFYPYAPNNISNQDTATFRLYGRGFTNIGDWRRDNVNLMVKHIYDTLMVIKPSIKFGMSPFGIWKPGVPAGVSGMDAYNILYCDPIAWIQNRTVDYLTPQLYWPFGGGQDYALLANWWGDSCFANRSHFYPGQAYYRNDAFSPSELPNQIRFDRNNPKIQGSVLFEAIDFMVNRNGFTDSLKTNLYSVPSLTPKFAWKDSLAKPMAPTNLSFAYNSITKKYNLTWTASVPGSDTAARYAIYRFDHNPTQAEINNGNHLVGISGTTSLDPNYTSFVNGSGNWYVVTGLNVLNNESQISNAYQVTQNAAAPVLVYPANNSPYQFDTVKVTWKGDNLSAAYWLQISSDSTFNSNMIVDIKGLRDSTYTVSGLSAQTKYFWRVRALSYAGDSPLSSIYSFKTAFPLPCTLLLPLHRATINTIHPVFVWNSSVSAASYRIQLSTSAQMTSLVKDTTVSDTTCTIRNLAYNKTYYWRVAAKNQYGTSQWSSIFGFKTPLNSGVNDKQLPSEYGLQQNFPNPFNPSTIINYSIKESGKVQLKIYNILGNEVACLVNQYKQAGKYSVEFNSAKLASGVYFYKINVNGFSDTKKMTVIK